MADPFIGETRMFGGNFAPSGWALCNGQLLSISQNSALFSILGTTYGGNGTTNFGLPNLQGQVPTHWGTSPAGTTYVIGETGGTENVTLLANQMPMHNHLISVNNQGGSAIDPTNALVAEVNTGTVRQPVTTTASFGATATGTMAPTAVSVAGGNIPHSNMQPFLCMTFIIALQGIYPSRG